LKPTNGLKYYVNEHEDLLCVGGVLLCWVADHQILVQTNNMKSLWEKIGDPKVLTAGGGILLAGLTMYILWNIVGNHIDSATKVQSETNKVILQQAVSNEKVSNSLDNLGAIIERTIR